ncbi:MupA/Atu3671 family FMN-dependent luciferase-like monooxygenase [Sulfitobacter sp. R18_1]|uniref:MupA/Atu3671 family FMN-dependent luciferase-like monooxygenase n=1 Tax=Sulfitobacter sp. R18_1 TaxID=2821104 RepID=UPI001AD96F1D|nr:MupA/Atu3671 family FMN-dependent luciferase-like monooxygenase [Sulfitobacter sp. R18_1]MBO9431627.1 LLM class flavin-dependent oxidoreductase [Sulfitobacter sp. R18_1]
MTVSFKTDPFTALLMGDESLTIACGDMLLAGGHRIAAVITRDAAVRAWAEGHGLALCRDAEELLPMGLAADWLLSIANLRLIPDTVLALPKRGAVNFHDGPLPRYAGLNTPAWAIINGEARHGVSWHLIETGVDTGDLLAQREVDIAADETAFSLNSKCYAAGMESFGEVLAQLESGSLQGAAQDLSQRSYFAKDKRPENGGLIDFTKTAEEIGALVLGLDFGSYWNPLTTAKILSADGAVLSVSRVERAAGQGGTRGEVVEVDEARVIVAAQDAHIALHDLRDMAGESVAPAQFFALGDMLTQTAGPVPAPADEAYWRRALTGFDALPVPLATATETPETWLAREITLPQGSDPLHQVAAAALVALRSAGATEGGIALRREGAPAPLIADWLPITITAEAETPVAELLAQLDPQLTRAKHAAGFARDLLLRDPAIDVAATPEFAISFDDEPLAGAALTLCLTPRGARLLADGARLSDAAVNLLAARLEAASAKITDASDCGTVWTLPETEAQILARVNATTRDYAPHTIHAAFEAQVERTPDAPALVFEGETLSYGALNARANRLAHLLRDMGAGPGMPVALCVARGVDLLVGTLGILKAGAAYVPLDPAYPADRLTHYLSDSGASIVVTQSALIASLPSHDAQVVEIDRDKRLATAPTANPAASVGLDDLAYLIYTSGSTGTPKGVMVSHGNVANFFAGMDDRIDHEAGAVWLAVTSLSFDISVLELFWTLARGFKLVLAGDDSRALMSNGPISTSDRRMDFNLFYWGNDDGVGPKKYELLLEGAKFADAHGFNAVWTPERHFHAFGGPYPNPSVTGAAVAAVTQNLDVRAGSCVAPLHHPARIAEEWAVIDNLTNGRVGLAIASGWQPDDFVLRPENTPPENKPAMYDAIDQLRRLWAGEAVEFPRADGTPHAVVTQPRPVSDKLPIWVTTAGNPQTWQEAGEIGANVLTHLLGQSVEEVADKIKIYHDALRAAGHDPADHRVTVMLHSYLAQTRAEAEKTARGPMKDYLRSAAGLIKQYAWAFPAFKKPAGTTNPFEIDLEGLSPDEMDAILEFAFQRYFNDSGMFGTVADGLARAEQLKRIGVDEIACLIDYGIPTDKVMAGLAPLAEVLRRANAGGQPAADDHSIAAQIIRHGVTHLQCTPSMAQMMVMNDEARGALARIKSLMIGGEALPGTLLRGLRAATPAQIRNMYGPTETTIWSTTHMLDGAEATTAPIGRPIANTQVHILDPARQPLPIGAPGELWIGGDGVTRGYWRRAEMTAARFIDDPFTGRGHLYGTGDLVRMDAEGVLHFEGRADAQVKIRGHRIELGEVEARLAELPGVRQAVAVLREDTGQGGAQLIGYVVAEKTVDSDAARRQLAAHLPDIMVPQAIVTLSAMPLTPNKKIDRKALPAPTRQSAATHAAPQAETPAGGSQAAIAQVWSALLGVGDIRGEDNFFALGGHSLLAVQAHRDIKAALDVSALSITDIFRFPTLAGLAAHIDGLGGKTAAPFKAPSAAETPARSETMSKRRLMRAARGRGRG